MAIRKVFTDDRFGAIYPEAYWKIELIPEGDMWAIRYAIYVSEDARRNGAQPVAYTTPEAIGTDERKEFAQAGVMKYAEVRQKLAMRVAQGSVRPFGVNPKAVEFTEADAQIELQKLEEQLGVVTYPAAKDLFKSSVTSGQVDLVSELKAKGYEFMDTIPKYKGGEVV